MRRDEEWFTRIYAAHYAAIVNYGRRRLLADEPAAELAQETFVIAWRRRADVPNHSLPWLYGVARRLLANEWRRLRVIPAPLPVPAQPGPELAAEVVDLYRALAKLSEPDQEILRLIGWEELTLGEAAKVLGCRTGSATVRLHRARRRLADVLSSEENEPCSAQEAPVNS